MKTFEERYTAWLDGALAGADLVEFEKELARHPDALADREAAAKLRRLLREHPTAPPLTNADFFALQIQQRIAAESHRPSASSSEKPALFSIFSRLAWAGVFFLMLAGISYFITVRGHHTQDTNYFAQVVEVWPSEPGIFAETVYDPKDNLTVVWLDGLEYLPASYELK
jgi:hypothetical protein